MRKLLAVTGAAIFTTSRFAAACPTGVSAAACGCPDGAHYQVHGSPCSPAASLGLGGPASLSGGGEGVGIENVLIQNFLFIPENMLIKPGTTVRWTNLDTVVHNSVRDPTWNSGLLNQNQTFDFLFTSANAGFQYDYLCDVHPFMTGVVRVARFGDANVDGNVNANDFSVLATHFGQQTGGTWETGDFNGDGVINANDFSLLATNFGRPIEPAGFFEVNFGSSVPEPGAAALLAMSLPLRRRAQR